MAIPITDLSNILAPDYDYPYGKFTDISAPGASDGTPVNTDMTNDWSQFFAKLMDEGGVTFNGLPDNDYSGFQLFEALEGLIPQIKYRGNNVYTDGNNLPVTLISGTSYVANFPTRCIEIGIATNIFFDTIDSLGDEMPIGTTLSITTTNSINPVNFVANSTNAGSNPVIRISANTTNNQSFSFIDQYSTIIFERKSTAWFAYGDIII